MLDGEKKVQDFGERFVARVLHISPAQSFFKFEHSKLSTLDLFGLWLAFP